MIESWLQQLEQYWVNHDIDGVISLFSEDVTYWETPHKKLNSVYEITNEWTAIKNQFDIRLNTSVYSKYTNRYTVNWDLFYSNESHDEKHWKGIYLIELNESGKCTYFYQVGESQA